VRRGRRVTAVERPAAGRSLRQALWAVILIAAALLAVMFTLPLLNRSITEFAIVAAVWWGAVFSGAVALTRSSSRKPTGELPDEQAPDGVVRDHAPIATAADHDS
jgi:predicted MFS family arabinose efflux permease